MGTFIAFGPLDKQVDVLALECRWLLSIDIDVGAGGDLDQVLDAALGEDVRWGDDLDLFVDGRVAGEVGLEELHLAGGGQSPPGAVSHGTTSSPTMLVAGVVRVEHHSVGLGGPIDFRRLVDSAHGFITHKLSRIIQSRLVLPTVAVTVFFHSLDQRPVGVLCRPDADRVGGMVPVLLCVGGKDKEGSPTLAVTGLLVFVDAGTGGV